MFRLPTKLRLRFQTQSAPDVNQLNYLTERILEIVVHEAKEQLQAQLQSHLATDQRGYGIAGLFSAVATATTGGFFSLVQSSSPTNFPPIAILIGGLWIAAFSAIVSVWPKPFCFPGNEPKNWLPDTWPAGKARTTKLAKFEQAKILQAQIFKNQKIAFKKAMFQIASLVIALLSTGLFALISA